MSYNGSGTFNINSTGQPVVTGTVISAATFNSLTADLGTGLTTAITKDGQTTATTIIPFAQGISVAGTALATVTGTGSIVANTNPTIASANLTTALTLAGAAGTSGQVLTSAGSGLPSWTTVSAGALTLISTTTASASATVDVENAFSTYDAYVLVITDLSAAQNDLRCRFKVGGTYLTTTTYRMGRRIMYYFNTTYSAQNQNDTTDYIDVYGGVPASAVGRAMGVVWINGTQFTNASFTNNVYGTWMNNAVHRADNVFGESTAGACTGLRFYVATGNIDTGKFRLYGVSNS